MSARMSYNADRPIGLIAGQGSLPISVVNGIHAAGRKVACVGLRGQFDAQLPDMCDHFEEVGLFRLGRWMKVLRRWGASETVMIGRVQKNTMYEPILSWLKYSPDWHAALLWFFKLRHDRRSSKVLQSLAEVLKKGGVVLVDSTQYISDQMSDEGVMTKARPNATQLADIEFAWPMLMQTAAMDIGQAVAVKDCEIISVEAMEGTNDLIERTGRLCHRGGWTLIKASRPNHDMRFDVPTVGLHTIEMMKKSGATCMVLEAGKVIMAEKHEVIAGANKHGIVILGRK